MGRKLYLSDIDRKIGGVCGGIAEYFNVDATMIRILWVVLSIFTTLGIGGIIIYIIAWAIMPKRRGF